MAEYNGTIGDDVSGTAADDVIGGGAGHDRPGQEDFLL